MTVSCRWIALALVLAACGGGSSGGEEADAAADAGPVADTGASDAAVDAALAARCLRDADCPDDAWCRLEDGVAEGRCAQGCRVDPDTCAAADARTLCDPATHECVRAPCAGDADCDDGQWCSEGACLPGCRLDPDDCGPSATCDPASRACAPHAACCDQFDECTLAAPSACGGESVPVPTCDPSPCLATRCEGDESCSPGEYCADFGRCRPGCRPGLQGECGPDEACDPATHACGDRACDADAACEGWQYCARGGCLDGCREGPESCPDGARCAPDHRCRSTCDADEACGEGYCDAALGTCRPACDPTTHDGCEPQERCEASTRCAVGCRPDAADPGDDTVEGAAPFPTEPTAGGGRVGAADRALCPGDVDFVAIAAQAGDRLQITLTWDPAEGAIDATLLDPDGDVVAEAVGPGESPRRLRWPALGDARPLVAGDHLLHVRAAHGGRVAYRLHVATVPAAGCFLDERDPGDDRPAGARSAGQRPRRDFEEPFEGSLCGDDADWFCFPMESDDGLEVTLVAPVACDALEGALFDRTALDAGEVAAAHRLGAGAPSPAGLVYRFEATPDAGAFTASDWCLRLSAAGGGRCEDYALTLGFHRRGAPCTDVVEPNDLIDRAFELDGNGPLADAEGRLPAGLDLEVPRAVRVCPDDVDLYRVHGEPGDTLRAWIAGDGAQGALEVAFLDALGQPQGTRAGLNEDPADDDREEALVLAAGAADFHVRVRGVGAGTGDYRLFVRRDPGVPGQCVQDVLERPGASNDHPDRATVLMGADPRRPGVQNGSLCGDEDDADEDWYRFEVADRMRTCIAATFRQADGDIDLELYHAAEGGPDARPCRMDLECAGEGPEGAGRCLDGFCQAPLVSTSNRADGEIIELARSQVAAGDYYLRVHSAEGEDNLYDLQVTLVPDGGACERDWRERERANDDRERSSFLGSGRAGVCDAWICHDERAAGDWYGIHVPPGVDRTALIAYAPREDGVLLLTFVNPDDPRSGFVESFELQTSVQCINIRGGVDGADVYLGVSADSVVQDGDARVDYTLQVVPTDLDRNRRGACDALSGNAFRHVEWPTAALP